MTTVLLAMLSLLIGLWHLAVLIGLWWFFVAAIRDECREVQVCFGIMLLVGVAWTALLFSGMAKVRP